jgi:hypothetical protein
MSEVKQISWDEFEEKYKPLQNHLDDNASVNGWMYETYGEELKHVMKVAKQDINRVWTFITVDGVPSITSGYHLVNRMGYIITEIGIEDEEVIDVFDEDDLITDQDEDDED